MLKDGAILNLGNFIVSQPKTCFQNHKIELGNLLCVYIPTPMKRFYKCFIINNIR